MRYRDSDCVYLAFGPMYVWELILTILHSQLYYYMIRRGNILNAIS